MPRDERVYLEDMLEAARRALAYSEGQSRESIEKDERTLDAILRNLEILGEAAKRVSDDTRDRIPTIEWRRIAGLRDILAHAYFDVDPDIIWDVIVNKLPGLVSTLSKELSL